MANGHHMEQRISRPSKKAYEINRSMSFSLMRNFSFPWLILGIEEEFQAVWDTDGHPFNGTCDHDAAVC